MLRFLIVCLFCLLPSLAAADVHPGPGFPPQPRPNPRPRVEQEIAVEHRSGHLSDALMFITVIVCMAGLVFDQRSQRRKGRESDLSDAE